MEMIQKLFAWTLAAMMLAGGLYACANVGPDYQPRPGPFSVGAGRE